MNFGYNIHTPEGSFAAYVARPATLPAPVVVVVHEAFGVSANMRARCDELAQQGFVAICPDLYWRQEREVDLSETDDKPMAFALYDRLDLDAAVRDVQATVTQMKGADLCSGRVGVLGYRLGALLTYLVAVRGSVDAGVCYHGNRTDDFLGEASSLDSPLLMHLAELDEWLPPHAQSTIRAVLIPKGVEIHDYPGCNHAVARHSGQHVDAQAVELASGRTSAFLKRYLVDA